MKEKLIQVMLILSLASSSYAAVTPKPVDINDFSGTSWVFYGNYKNTFGRLGSWNYSGAFYATFNNDGTVLFESRELGFQDYFFQGIYYIDPNNGNLVVDIDDEEFWGLLNDNLEVVLENSKYAEYFDDWSFEVEDLKPKIQVTYNGDTMSLSFRASYRTRMETLDWTGRTRYSHISFKMIMAGDHPVAGKTWPQEKWAVKTKMSVRVKNARTIVPANLEIALTELNSYLIVDSNETIFWPSVEGSFCRIKNKLYFFDFEDDGDLELSARDFISENNPGISNLDIYDLQPMVTATIKNSKKGESIRLSAKIRCRADIELNNGKSYEFTKGTLKITGKGVPIPHPDITYSIGSCDQPEGTSERKTHQIASLTETRFTATVEGRYIHFEDKMHANCCAIPELIMGIFDNTIMITEHEAGPVCLCLCDLPVDANLGPFPAGEYQLIVYQDQDNLIGSTIVTIE